MDLDTKKITDFIKLFMVMGKTGVDLHDHQQAAAPSYTTTCPISLLLASQQAVGVQGISQAITWPRLQSHVWFSDKLFSDKHAK